MSLAREGAVRFSSRVIVEIQPGVQIAHKSAVTREFWCTLKNYSARLNPFVRSITAVTLQCLQARSQLGTLPPISDLGQFWSVVFDGRRVSAMELAHALKRVSIVAHVHLEEGVALPSVENFSSKNPNYFVRDLGTELFREFAGGSGEFASLADVEGGWEVRSPWYRLRNPQPIWGNPSYQTDRLHGEKTLSVLLSSGNSRYPETGVAPGLAGSILLSSYVTSPMRCDTANAILAAIVRLIERPGSILLLEVTRGACHRRSPVVSLPTEFFAPDFHAIRLAASLGITVIEAAGNGANGEGLNLNDSVERGKERAFIPEQVKGSVLSPILQRDSGAILVGSVDPSASGANNSVRLTAESNWGTRLNCASIGRGLAVLKRGSDVELGVYGGTSAASAIIAGMLAVVQSIRAKQRRPPVTPMAFRSQLQEVSATKNPVEFRIPTASDLIFRFVNN